jgi:exonuclease SbcD
MKLLHIADLHLGKRVCEYPMLEDQRHILREIADLARSEAADALLIAGDVYDRPVPPQEAVTLLSDFLCELSAAGIPVYLIAGNHDSAERLDFCAALLGGAGIHIVGECRGSAETVLLQKGEERVALHLLPHFRPLALRRALDEEVSSSEEAFRALIARTDLSLAPINILLAHTFVTGAATSESEQVVVGTVDAVPADVFARFDYVALGHLHRPQTIGKNVRYAGSPLCYSFSEVGQSKTLTVIETGENVCVRTLLLHPLHEMREVKGSLSELLAMPYSEDYIRAVVTDEDVPPDARVSLQGNFPNLMRFAVENSRTAHEEEITFGESVMLRDPLELFAEFYHQQNGTPPDEARLALMKAIFEGEGEKQ